MATIAELEQAILDLNAEMIAVITRLGEIEKFLHFVGPPILIPPKVAFLGPPIPVSKPPGPITIG